MTERFKIIWIDAKREPQCPPDPSYPEGLDIDGTGGRSPSCLIQLPYPARRCGQYVVECKLCGYVIAITTAGRLDDPRSVRMPCNALADGMARA
jgi:hypothetical protein